MGCCREATATGESGDLMGGDCCGME